MLRGMRIPFFFILFLISGAQAADLTKDYLKVHKKKTPLTWQENQSLGSHEFVLVPGILAESFIQEDSRSTFNFSLLTKDYFGSQFRYLEERGFRVRRVKTSSFSVDESKLAIAETLRNTDKKLIFMTHSLGGMALLDFLIENEAAWEKVGGVVFLQSPFGGAPVASVLQHSPGIIQKFLDGIMGYFNTSEETLEYLSIEKRRDFIEKNRETLTRLTRRIPVLTVGGVVNGRLFTPFLTTTNVIRHGCPTPVFGVCALKVYQGPFDQSDGMVPFKNSLLPGADFLKIDGVDHGETVVETYVGSIDRRRMTEALLKIFVKKLNTSL